MKRWISGFICLLICGLLLSSTVYAAIPMENHNHVDTDDYCLRANDVQIGLKELTECENDAQRWNSILQAADPIVLIRGDDESFSQFWVRLVRPQYTVNFKDVKWEKNDEGYPVTITAPPVFTDKPSEISFRIYIIDDMPKQKLATITFYKTQLPDYVIDITKRTDINYLDLTEPVMVGYTFAGWYLDEGCTIPFLLAGSSEYGSQKIEGSLVLYPKWIKNQSQKSSKNSLSNIQSPTGVEATTIKVPVAHRWKIRANVQGAQGLTAEFKENDKDVHISHPVSPITRNTSKIKEEITPIEIVLLLAGSIAILSLAVSIVSDLRVLHWYREKKKGRMMY